MNPSIGNGQTAGLCLKKIKNSKEFFYWATDLKFTYSKMCHVLIFVKNMNEIFYIYPTFEYKLFLKGWKREMN